MSDTSRPSRSYYKSTSSVPLPTTTTAASAATGNSSISVGTPSSRVLPSSARRLYEMQIMRAPSSLTVAVTSTRCCCFGPRKQACLLGGLAVFQTVAVLMIMTAAFSANSNGVQMDADGQSLVAGFNSVRLTAHMAARFGLQSLLSEDGMADAGTGTQWPLELNSTLIEMMTASNNTTTTTSVGQRYTFNSELNVTLIEMQSLLFGADCLAVYLRHYNQFCQATMTPAADRQRRTGSYGIGASSSTIATTNADAEREKQADDDENGRLCSCVPISRLVGRVNPLSSDLQPPVVLPHSMEAPEVASGGRWAPSDCVARQRLAIVIPFRDREAHLRSFLRYMHPFLQRQLADYTIFVVEQDEPKRIFNKASVMNAGFVEIRSISTKLQELGVVSGQRPFDCFIFHDVDMLPEDDRNFYGCGAVLPRHVGAYVNKWDYSLMYYRIFGGATAFRPEVFEHVNGFSNEFYGWGGEDDDMLRRIEARNLTFVRYPKCVAKYSMIKHNKDKRNPYNAASGVAWQSRPDQYRRNGLNNLRYELVAAERRPLYTWLLVNLPPPS